MKKALAACMFIASALGTFAAATVTDASGKLTISVPAGEDYDLSTHASGIAANTWTEIVKTGLGTLNGAGSFTTTAFTGTVRVKEGYFYASSRDSLPDNAAAKVVVEGDSTGGGTLKTYSTASGFKWTSTAHLYLSGMGVGEGDGSGVGSGVAVAVTAGSSVSSLSLSPQPVNASMSTASSRHKSLFAFFMGNSSRAE